jgi:molybdenum cofactor cytidylyltransferase
LIAAGILAAGKGERFGGTTPKPLVHFRGRPLVAHVLEAVTGSGLAPVFLVVGNHAAEVATQAPAAVTIVPNPAWASGIASSLVALLRVLADHAEVDAVVIGLADQPLVGPEAYRRVAATYDDGARLAVATYHGERANPVLLARAHWDEAMTLTGDEGARVLLRRHAAVDVACDGTGSPIDIDTPEDLAALEND